MEHEVHKILEVKSSAPPDDAGDGWVVISCELRNDHLESSSSWLISLDLLQWELWSMKLDYIVRTVALIKEVGTRGNGPRPKWLRVVG